MKFKNILLALLFFIGCCSQLVRAQESISDYSFIQVPYNYSFLKSDDQYQLNSISKFLFNKYGFNAYFPNELPNVRKCDGVYAEVEGKPGFIYTRITIIVKDCSGNELFRSLEGKSKRKDYKGAYQEALREAFNSFIDLGIDQKDIELSSKVSDEDEKVMKESVSEEKPNLAVSTTSNLPTARFSNYSKNGTSYLLRKTTEGYSLYQEVKGADDDLLLLGKLSIQDGVVTYMNVMGETYEANFNEDKSLEIHLPGGKATYRLIRN